MQIWKYSLLWCDEKKASKKVHNLPKTDAEFPKKIVQASRWQKEIQRSWKTGNEK